MDASIRLISYKQAGAMLGVQHRTVAAWVREGVLPGYIIPGRVRSNRVTLQSVLDLIAKGRANSEQRNAQAQG